MEAARRRLIGLAVPPAPVQLKSAHVRATLAVGQGTGRQQQRNHEHNPLHFITALSKKSLHGLAGAMGMSGAASLCLATFMAHCGTRPACTCHDSGSSMAPLGWSGMR